MKLFEISNKDKSSPALRGSWMITDRVKIEEFIKNQRFQGQIDRDLVIHLTGNQNVTIEKNDGMIPYNGGVALPASFHLAPKGFTFEQNDISTLVGSPLIVGDRFKVSHSDVLEDLSGFPKMVSGTIYLNELKSLKSLKGICKCNSYEFRGLPLLKLEDLADIPQDEDAFNLNIILNHITDISKLNRYVTGRIKYLGIPSTITKGLGTFLQMDILESVLVNAQSNTPLSQAVEIINKHITEKTKNMLEVVKDLRQHDLDKFF